MSTIGQPTIEAWGRGIAKINRECREHGIAQPIFNYHMSGLMLTFHANPQHLIAALGEEMARRLLGEKVGEKTWVETTQEATQKTTQKTTQKILVILTEHPSASRKEIAERLADITESGVKYHLNRLRAEGKIRRVGPDRGGHWEVL